MPLSDSIIYLLLHFVLTFRALVFAVVYVVAGVILKKFYKKEGSDVIPNKVFWVSLPGYVKVMQSIHIYVGVQEVQMPCTVQQLYRQMRYNGNQF